MSLDASVDSDDMDDWDDFDKIIREILEDTDGEVERKHRWFDFMEGRMDFPFKAYADIRKRNGSAGRRLLEVVGFAAVFDRFGGDALYVHVDYHGIMIPVEVRDIEPANATSETRFALEVWSYGKSPDFDLKEMLYYLNIR
jgi:Calcium binding